MDKQTKAQSQETLKKMLGHAANALGSQLGASLGFPTPEAFKKSLIQALDDHRGFGKVVREWHEYHRRGAHAVSDSRLRARQRTKDKDYKMPLAHAGRPVAARNDGGAKKQGQHRG
jgi:hypothetical protein